VSRCRLASPSPSFDRCAERYDELRPVDDSWWEVFGDLVRLGNLRGRRVLEVGCGTGRMAAALAEREHARVWAVDAAPAMVERASALGVNARVARAAALPFKPGWFDAVVMRMVAHLLDRSRAFPEAQRVLGAGGRIAIATHDPESFDRVWFAPFFPSFLELERSRFPGEERLRGELVAAGFGEVVVERRIQPRQITREHALDILRSQAYSTFELLPPAEYAAGVARAEADLPAHVDYAVHWLLAAAST
jgi:ubiquinone/menaquinone biosynthesis C-methylase UbiE